MSIINEPNFSNWLVRHFQCVRWIVEGLASEKVPDIISQTAANHGTGGLYELSLEKSGPIESSLYTDPESPEYKNKFPNGFENRQETHYEMVEGIISKIDSSETIRQIHQRDGDIGLYSLSESLTDEFEMNNAGRFWDGEFFDEVSEFLHRKLC